MRPEPSSFADSTSPARIARWLDLMRTTDRLLLAGLQHKIGPSGDLQAAYRRWYAEHMQEHDAVVERIAQHLTSCQRESSHAH